MSDHFIVLEEWHTQDNVKHRVIFDAKKIKLQFEWYDIFDGWQKCWQPIHTPLFAMEFPPL